MTTWASLRVLAEERLTRCGADAPTTEALWILEDASGLSGAELVANPDGVAPQRAHEAVLRMLQRRVDGEPLQYVLGHWSFRGLDLFVDPRVLIPRPETETVVETALEAMATAGFTRGPRNGWTGTTTRFAVADLGTGSGAIAIALASELPDAEVWATDVSPDALAVARANIAGCGATRVRLAEGSWFDALPSDVAGRLVLVVANPPYIGATEWETLEPVVRDHEPFAALVGGPDGFEPVEEIIRGAPQWLAPRGVLVVEMAPHQTDRALQVADDCGYLNPSISYDLAGRARALVATKPKDTP